jgi:hypothetical protein
MNQSNKIRIAYIEEMVTASHSESAGMSIYQVLLDLHAAGANANRVIS